MLERSFNAAAHAPLSRQTRATTTTGSTPVMATPLAVVATFAILAAIGPGKTIR
ncbi:hypothetical protein ABRP24_000720 [Curtobacterium sp. WHRI 8282]|uniref:hypothetical protein n=1 Tax=Curtobacterium sp. WHRI 8282 TaxID=3162559 RepID=UPI0035316BDB